VLRDVMDPTGAAVLWRAKRLMLAPCQIVSFSWFSSVRFTFRKRAQRKGSGVCIFSFESLCSYVMVRIVQEKCL
jgi:arginine exporter protein ArgO